MVRNKAEIAFVRKACPVCHGSKRHVLLESLHNTPDFLNFIKCEKYYGDSYYNSYHQSAVKDLHFQAVVCDDCEMIYLTEVLNDHGMSILYNDWLDKILLRQHYENLPVNPYEEIILGVIKKSKARAGQSLRVMDFGAGYGKFCKVAVRLGYSTFAYDISDDKNDHMDGLGITITSNLEQYNQFFDFIWVNQVFEHLAEPGEILLNLKKALKPDGIIFISVPNCKNIRQIISQKGFGNELKQLLSPHQHINAFTNHSLRQLGERHGLQPLQWPDFLRMYNFKLNKKELIYLTKTLLKNSKKGTDIFFKKK
jgi:SAM-dependent methyltransferase